MIPNKGACTDLLSGCIGVEKVCYRQTCVHLYLKFTQSGYDRLRRVFTLVIAMVNGIRSAAKR